MSKAYAKRGRPSYCLREDPDRRVVALVEAQRLIWLASGKRRESGRPDLRGEFPLWKACEYTAAFLWPQLPSEPKQFDGPPPREPAITNPAGRKKATPRSLRDGYREQQLQTGGRPRGPHDLNRPQDPFTQAVDNLRKHIEMVHERGGSDRVLLHWLAHMWVHALRPDLTGCSSFAERLRAVDWLANRCGDHETACFVNTFIERMEEMASHGG